MMRQPEHLDSSATALRDQRSYSQTIRYPELADLGHPQRWVFSRLQLRGRGFDRHRIDHEIRSGRWIPVGPNVVVAQNGPLTLQQRLWTGVLHAGEDAALSHLTACLASGLQWRADDPAIHVITKKGDLVSALPGYRFHQTRRAFRPWVYVAVGEPNRISLPYAALLCAERDRSVRRGIGLLAATVQQRLTTADELIAAATRIRKLRNGNAFAAVLGDIAGGAESFSEIEVARWCGAVGLVPPTRQSRRRGADGRWRYNDLEWVLPDGRVIALEVDGGFHMEVEHWWRDKQRDRQLVVAGTTVLRCTSLEIRLEPYALARDLLAMGVPRAR